MARITKADKNRSHKSRNLEDHIVDKATVNIVDNEDKGVQWEAQKGEVHSSTKLEDDTGDGKPVIVRSFVFSANPVAFRQRTPSKQELFNAHALQIEGLLWKDGLQVMPDVVPQLVISKNKKFYRIVVGAEARKGHLLHEKPVTLKDFVPTRNTA